MPPPRRRVLEIGIWAILATIGSILGGILGSIFALPAFARRQEEWLTVGDLDKLSETPQRFDLVYTQRQGWYQEQRAEVLYAYRKDGNPVVLSSTCTHLGCTVRWDSDSAQFHCPCHGGVYDSEGEVLVGPPERPLARPEVRIEGERILIQKA